MHIDPFNLEIRPPEQSLNSDFDKFTFNSTKFTRKLVIRNRGLSVAIFPNSGCDELVQSLFKSVKRLGSVRKKMGLETSPSFFNTAWPQPLNRYPSCLCKKILVVWYEVCTSYLDFEIRLLDGTHSPVFKH